MHYKFVHVSIFGSVALMLLTALLSPAIAEEYPPEVAAKIQLCFEPADASKLEAAKDACTALLAMNSLDDQHRGRIYMMRGNAYDNTGDKAHALADFDKAVELDPGEARIFYNRGVYYMSQHDAAHAKADFMKATLLDDKLIPAFFNLAQVDVQLGDFAGVLDAVNVVIRSNPTNARAFLLRAMANGKLGNNDAAAADIVEAVRLDPSLANQIQVDGKPMR